MTDASAYDEWHGEHPTGNGPWYELVESYLDGHDSIVRGARGLEVGGGECRFSCRLAARGAASVIGTDLSPAAIASARRQATPANVTFEVQDAHALTFEDGAFDVVICCEMLEHVPDAAGVLREIARVLRPEGSLLLTFPNYMSLTGLHRLFRKSRGRDDMEGGQPIANFTTYPQISRWVRAAGMRIEATSGRGHYLPIPRRQPVDLTAARPGARHAARFVALHVLIHATVAGERASDGP